MNKFFTTEYGYILEVDINNRKELHDNHIDFAATSIKWKPRSRGTEKLLLTLEDKEKYVVY